MQLSKLLECNRSISKKHYASRRDKISFSIITSYTYSNTEKQKNMTTMQYVHNSTKDQLRKEIRL